MADTLIERLREKCGTINFGGQQYAIFPPATDPLRLEAAAELERLSAEVARLQQKLEVARRDALRYRWLREQFTWDNFGQWPPDDPQVTIRWVMLFPMSEPLDWDAPVEEWNPQGKLDAAIDAAREG